jgi:hypothetical protein
MTNLILPPVDFAAVIAEILEDYLPEDRLIHSLTDQQVSDMFNDLAVGCEEAYEEASEKAEEAIEEAYELEAGIDPYDLPTSGEEPFHTSEVLQEAIADMKQGIHS